MAVPRNTRNPAQLQQNEAKAAAPKSYNNALLVPLSDKIEMLRQEAAAMQAEGVTPLDLLVRTRSARVELAYSIRDRRPTLDEQLDAQHKSRLDSYGIFLHGMVLTPSLMAYGPENNDARAIRHITTVGNHQTVVAMAAMAAKRAVCSKGDTRPAATREATILALGTRKADPNAQILPALTRTAAQQEHAEYFTYSNEGQVMHTHVHLDGTTRRTLPSQPGQAVVSRGVLGLMAGCHPWNSPASNQTVFALENELTWQRTPSYPQDRNVMCDLQTGLDVVTQDIMNILNNSLIVYDPTL